MTLHEEMARRLIDVAAAKIPGHTTSGRAVNFEMMEDLADECIRQMEWARKYHPTRPPREQFSEPIGAFLKCPCGQILQTVEASLHHWEMGHFDTQGPLTLAPEDWKP